jgi:Fe-S cluster assembly iron-binding protein IscA
MEITSNAADKVAGMKSGQEHLRVYITGGGCSGFNYGFILDETVILVLRRMVWKYVLIQ